MGKSSDAGTGKILLDAVSIHRGVINCADRRGRRWSLITDLRDFLPRSIFLKALPDVSSGDALLLELDRVPVAFEPTLPPLVLAAAWEPLIAEWLGLIYEDGLYQICRALEQGAPVQALCGLGDGFTPAGDDFIAGCLTGMRCSGKSRGLADSVRLYRKCDLKNTTWFSGWIISDAALGKIWGARRAFWSCSPAPGRRAWLSGFAYAFN